MKKLFPGVAFVLGLFLLVLPQSTPAQAQDYWGAVAFNARGATGTAWRRLSQQSAVREALAACRRNATIPCKVLSGANAACGVVSIGTRGNSRTAFGVIRAGLGNARNAALAQCRNAGYGGCSIRTVMCAAGQHR
ncbi:MAG: DUF4189 domain-containing protein [Beijerinckiaceae bacterium]